MTYQEALTHARTMRKNASKAEAAFWQRVRNRKLLGKKFNRQFLFPYFTRSGVQCFFILDFYCHEHQLVVEIDGSIHEHRQEQDAERTEILNSHGLTVLRFTNEAVLLDWPRVAHQLQEFLTTD